MTVKEFKIYQVPEDSEFFHDYGFRALDGLRRAHLGPPLPREAYELVYTWRTTTDPSLDWVFCHFNHSGIWFRCNHFSLNAIYHLPSSAFHIL